VFEDWVLRKISVLTRDQVAGGSGGWRNLSNEDFHNLYSSTDISRMLRSRIMWAGRIARMGRREIIIVSVGLSNP
jgi:hypothetical protein